MTLTLEILAPLHPGQAKRHVFTEEGGMIGRSGNSAWVLSHNEVSGRHAYVSFQNGVFYIEDKSRNGVSVNSPENRLARERPYALKHGDRLFIDPYEIEVSIGTAAAARESVADPFGGHDPFAQEAGVAKGSPLLDSAAEVISGGEVDPMKFFPPVTPANRRTPEPPPMPSDDDPLGAHYQPPVVRSDPSMVPNSGIIPAGYNPAIDSAIVPIPRPSAEPRPRPTPKSPVSTRSGIVLSPLHAGQSPEPIIAPAEGVPAEPPRPVAPVSAPPVPVPPVPASPVSTASAATNEGESQLLRQVLIGAGVPDAAITPQLARSIGQIIRVVVAGLIDVLQARQRIKEEFQLRQTVFRPSDNNPLKFSADVDHALQNLLVTRTAAFLAPVDAFADAFEDLRNHQLAMLAGMRMAFEAMLSESDPERLQEEFDRQIGKVSLPLVPSKMRYWDLYRERHEALLKDREAAFTQLFGDEFARAYEEQFQKLKDQRKARAGGAPSGPPHD